MLRATKKGGPSQNLRLTLRATKKVRPFAGPSLPLRLTLRASAQGDKKRGLKAIKKGQQGDKKSGGEG